MQLRAVDVQCLILVKKQIRQLGRCRAFPVVSAKTDRLIGVTQLRCGFLQKVAQKLLNLFPGQPTGGQIPFIKRCQVPVKMTAGADALMP